MATKSLWNRIVSLVKGQYEVPAPDSQPKIIAYEKSKILRVTKDGLEYSDEKGNKFFIDFSICHKNFERDGYGRLKQVGGSEGRNYVGFRDFGVRPAIITFWTDPPTRFEFPLPTELKMATGGKFLQRDPEDIGDFDEFHKQLYEAGVMTLDMS